MEKDPFKRYTGGRWVGRCLVVSVWVPHDKKKSREQKTIPQHTREGREKIKKNSDRRTEDKGPIAKGQQEASVASSSGSPVARQRPASPATLRKASDRKRSQASVKRRKKRQASDRKRSLLVVATLFSIP